MDHLSRFLGLGVQEIPVLREEYKLYLCITLAITTVTVYVMLDRFILFRCLYVFSPDSWQNEAPESRFDIENRSIVQWTYFLLGLKPPPPLCIGDCCS